MGVNTKDSKETPIVLVVSKSGVTYIGERGERGERVSGCRVLHKPLVYQEFKDGTKVGLTMNVRYHGLGLIDHYHVETSEEYFLKGNREKDRHLIKQYEDALIAIKAKEAGIITPGEANTVK